MVRYLNTMIKHYKTLFIGLLVVVVLVVFSQVSSAHVSVNAESLASLGLREGDIVGSNNASDPDIYIVNETGFKRLFISPTIFSFYGHLRYENVKRLNDTVVDSFPTSALFRNCESGDTKVYALEVRGEDMAVLHWVNLSGEQAVSQDEDFFLKIFCINTREFSWYSKGTAYTSLSQVPVYNRSTITVGVNETSMPLSLPSGFRISKFTPNAVGPLRFMAFSPDGILFVSMPSAAGLYSGSSINNGAIFAFPDKDGNGVADETRTVISGLHIPHGLAFYNGYLYVAEEGKISRYPYLNDGKVGTREVIFSGLPTGGEHLSRTIVFGTNGKMYVSVGSSCNNCVESNQGFGAVWEMNPDGTGSRIFAKGLRNAVGLVSHPVTGELWATENSRDFLGDDLPPDEINIIRDGGHYGWPYCYGAKVVDPKYNNAGFCSTSQASIYNLQAHSAPLGLGFINGSQFPSAWAGDLIVARHGSWNRTQPVGYDVVRLDVEGNSIVGEEVFISGWLTAGNNKIGRPVDVIFGPDGALYVSDDKANIVYRVTASR